MIELALITLLTIAASMIGTMTGFGTSTIMVPVLLLFFPLAETLLLVGIIHLFGDVWKMVLFRSGIRWKLILTFAIPGVLFSFLGASLTFQLPEDLLSRALGAVLVAYVVFLFAKPKFKIPESNVTAVLGGSLAGLVAGIFGVGGAVRGAFLAAFNLPKAAYLFTNGVIALFIDATRLTTYVAGGVRLPTLFLAGLLIFIPASFAGAKLAEKTLKRIPEKSFRSFVAIFLLLVGLKLLLFP
jgi:hypothetical protein